MSEETIVAVYDTDAHADAAIRGLRDAHVPESAITRRGAADAKAGAGSPASATDRQGFWASTFGGTPDHDTAMYDRSIDTGSTVVAVRVPSEHYDKVSAILERHSPLDLDDRMVAVAQGGATDRSVAAKPAATGTGDTIKLSEETLSVGKRAVSGGTTRIRRYVVETPVEEQVTLHQERVVLDRHKVTDGAPVGADAFTDKTIEMTETTEEAVVAKTARVVEEISLRKDVTDDVKTIKDTVRRDEVEVEVVPGSAGTTATPLGVPADKRPKV